MQQFAFHINCSQSNSGNKISLIFTCEKAQKRISETGREKLLVKGAISGSILNTPLGDARFYEHNGQITLTNDGGQGVVTLAAAADPSQTPLISAAAEFRIANYGATDTDEFLFFQS